MKLDIRHMTTRELWAVNGYAVRRGHKAVVTITANELMHRTRTVTGNA